MPLKTILELTASDKFFNFNSLTLFQRAVISRIFIIINILKTLPMATPYFFIEGISWIILLQDLASNQESGDKTGSVQRNIGLALIGTNHILSAIDGGLSAHRYNTQVKEKYNLSLGFHQPTRQFVLAYRYCF